VGTGSLGRGGLVGGCEGAGGCFSKESVGGKGAVVQGRNGGGGRFSQLKNNGGAYFMREKNTAGRLRGVFWNSGCLNAGGRTGASWRVFCSVAGRHLRNTKKRGKDK